MSRKQDRAVAGLFIGFLFVAFVLPPAGAIAGNTIKIGLIEPISGPTESMGRICIEATKFVVNEQNAKGGLLGKKIEIVTADSEMKPDVATRKARNLILNDNVDLLGVAVGSNIALALAKVAGTEKKLLINYGALADVAMGKEFNRYVFRTCNNTFSYAACYVELFKKRGYKKIYFFGPDYAASYDNVGVIKDLLKARMPEASLIGTDFHPMGAKEFGPFITKIKAAKPDVVVCASLTNDLVNFLRQARDLGLGVPVASHAIVDPGVLMALQDAAIGVTFVNQYDLNLPNAENKAMIAKFHQQHKKDKDFLQWWPYGIAGAGASGWQLVFAAIEKAGTLDTEKLISTLEGFSAKTSAGVVTIRACDHQGMGPMLAGHIAKEDPFWDGSVDPKVKFPWLEANATVIPAKDVAIPATPDYNSRCK